MALWEFVSKACGKLIGQYKGTRECHIEPDWLLIYEATEDEIILVRTGTHSDLFQS